MPIVKGFRRFQPNILSSRQVVTDLVSGSNIERFRRSSFTTYKPIRKRVNIAIRREMLESFVNKYRATNQGNFPSPNKGTQRSRWKLLFNQKLLQEMEHNAKTSPVTVTVEENKKQTKGDDALSSETAAIESSGSQITDDQNLSQDLSGSNFDKNIDIRSNNNITIDDNKKIATETDEKPEQNLRDDNLAFNDSESKLKKQPDAERSITREVSKRENEKTSLWGNLKWMANEFINIWKK